MIAESFGPYRLVGKLGEGGMGAVYRAHDTKLGRDVALKVLPDAFASDPERIARFEREARTLAALNHPNVAQIYGFETSGTIHALAMELVPGPDLAARLAVGPLSIADTLAVARQIALALEAAHEQGIVHRDLKPANVKVRDDGAVKVLDFGLAKALDPPSAGRDFSPPSAVANSPTITTPAMTQLGMILGTAAYMAPEQARGRPVDKRADIWAFGCVLYEMLTGRRAFAGEDVGDTLASVLAREPDFDALPADTPPRVRRVVELCLRKDPRQRVQAAGDVRLALEGAFETAPAAEAPATGLSPPVRPMWRRVLPVAAALAAGALAAGALTWTLTRPEPPRVTRLEITAAGDNTPRGGGIQNLAALPDGSGIAFLNGNLGRLVVRALGSLEPTVIAVPANLRQPFVSPDGTWIGVGDSGANLALRKVATAGGLVEPITRIDGNLRGGSWGEDDTIVFATNITSTGLQLVPAAGGAPVTLTTPDRSKGEVDHLFPEWLPGGAAVLFTITMVGGTDTSQIAVLDMASRTYTPLIRGAHARYVPSGHLVFSAGGRLMAVRFDLAGRRTMGAPVPVVPVDLPVGGGMSAALSKTGTLVYLPAGAGESTDNRTVVWVDRQGRETAVGVPARAYSHVRVSPDGSRVVAYLNDQQLDLWAWDVARPALGRVTDDPTTDTFPVWAADRLYFSSQRGGPRNLYVQSAAGTGAPERLTNGPNRQDANALTPDGARLVFTEFRPETDADILALDLATKQTTELVATRFREMNADVSRNGRWLAYQTNESGQFEIQVRPFPDVARDVKTVSVGGGTRPVWSRDSGELFYFGADGALMRVGMAPGAALEPTPPVKVLDPKYFAGDDTITGRTFDVAPGGRFLMIKPDPSQARPTTFIVVQHFDEELRRLLPR